MSDTYVNIRFYYWHFKIYRSFKPSIERNSYWQHYYSFKGPKPKEPLFAVY